MALLGEARRQLPLLDRRAHPSPKRDRPGLISPHKTSLCLAFSSRARSFRNARLMASFSESWSSLRSEAMGKSEDESSLQL